MISGRRNRRRSDDDRWPPVRCGACESDRSFASADSDHPGYRMLRCRNCGHRIYRLLPGQMVIKDQDHH